MFINNEWQDAVGGATFNDINPSTEKVTARVAKATEVSVQNCTFSKVLIARLQCLQTNGQ